MQENPETPSNGLFTLPPPPSLHLTSTPVTANSSLHSSLQVEPYRSSAVKLAILYPSKTVNKFLVSENEAIGKALIYSPPQRIANAVVTSKLLTQHMVQVVLWLLLNEVCGLCSRSNPSLVRKCNRESLVNFSFQSVCKEWKSRVPIFYSFLMTCSSVQLTREKLWLLGVAIAGFVLLEHWNPQMNATASALAVLLKTGSVKVWMTISIWTVYLGQEGRQEF